MTSKPFKPTMAIRGASNGTPFGQTPDGFAPFRNIRNARVYGVDSGRPRASRRPCLRTLLPQALKDAAVQAVLAVTRASARTGYALGQCREMGTAVSNPSSALVGQIAALDSIPSMDWFKNLDVRFAGGPADADVQAMCWDPDGEFLAVASNYAIGSDGAFSVARINPNTGGVVWRADYHASGKNASVNAIVVTKLYTFVLLANSNAAGPFLLGYRNDTGAEAINGNLAGWAREAVAGCRTVDDAGQECLFVAFLGSPTAGTYTGGLGSGTIQAGRWAMDFRSGIMKFSVEGATYGGGGTTMVPFGSQLSSSSPYYEAVHHYWRFSEQLPWAPHGAEPTGLASGPDGSVYFTKRNQGWGPNDGLAIFKPDGQSEGYRTVGKISAAGTLLWLQDTDSLRKLDDLGNYNDLTFPGDPLGPDPSIQALCVDPTSGDCYAAGRQNAGGACAFAMDGRTGAPIWPANITSSTGSVREGAAALDVDGNPIFAGDRNDDWDGSSGRFAHWWKLSKQDGSVLAFFDLNKPGIGGLSVAAAGDGRTFFSVNKVT